jgi:hypothetical protein
MTIRTRLSLWYATIMFIALMAMGVLLYHQLVIEPRQEARRHHQEREEEAVDPDVFEDVTGIVMWCGGAGGTARAGRRLVAHEKIPRAGGQSHAGHGKNQRP